MRGRDRKAKSDPRPGLLFVVSRHAPKQYEYLKRVFVNDKRVIVILDRRVGERRKTSSAPAGERRRADRRSSPAIDDRDRKSTRLNSSHTVISYAVFCLKKKSIHTDCAYSSYAGSLTPPTARCPT